MQRAYAFIGFSVGLLITCLVASPSVGAAKRLACSKKGSQTLAASEHVRLSNKFFSDDSQVVYACLYGQDRQVVLESTRGVEDVDLGVREIRVVGPFVAYRRLTSIKGSIPEEQLLVWDLRSPSEPKYILPLSLESAFATDLELSTDGFLAWIDQRPGAGPRVQKMAATSCTDDCSMGDIVTIDEGAGIEGRSLAVSGSTLYWTKANSPRSATLEGSGGSPTPNRTGQSDPRCSRSGSQTVAATSEARIFKKHRRVLGCLDRVNRAFELGSVINDPVSEITQLLHFRLAGRYVAYGYASESRYGHYYAVYVTDLRTGKDRWDLASGLFPGDRCGGRDCRGTGPPRDIELKQSGSVAWVLEDRHVNRGNFEVAKTDGRGQTMLDRGPEIDPESLARSGSIIYWTKGEQPYSAPLN